MEQSDEKSLIAFSVTFHGVLNISRSMFEEDNNSLVEEQREKLELIIGITSRLSQLVYDILDLRMRHSICEFLPFCCRCLSKLLDYSAAITTNGVGLLNISKRLMLEYGVQLEVESTTSVGTKITVRYL